MKPYSEFLPDLMEPTKYPYDKVAWAGVLDKRFCIEIQRKEPYKGNLVIFDSKNDYKVICEKEVPIMYDARYGPDHDDVFQWQQVAADFVDNEFRE